MALLFSSPAIQQLARFPLASGSVATLLAASEFRQQLLADIRTARHRIYITALYFQDDEAGREIMLALQAAKNRCPELDIKVLVDWHRAQRGLIGAGKQAGNAAWYQAETRSTAHPVPIYGVAVQTRELFGVLHLKGFVIDDVVLYSGASLNNVYLHKQDKYRHDRYHVINSAELADCLVNYIRHDLLSSPAVHRLDTPDCPTTRSLRKEIRESVAVRSHFAGDRVLELRQFHAFGLRNIENVHHPETNQHPLMFRFLFLFRGIFPAPESDHGRENLDAPLAPLDESAQFPPCAVSGHARSRGPLPRNGEDVAK